MNLLTLLWIDCCCNDDMKASTACPMPLCRCANYSPILSTCYAPLFQRGMKQWRRTWCCDFCESAAKNLWGTTIGREIWTTTIRANAKADVAFMSGCHFHVFSSLPSQMTSNRLETPDVLLDTRQIKEVLLSAHLYSSLPIYFSTADGIYRPLIFMAVRRKLW